MLPATLLGKRRKTAYQRKVAAAKRRYYAPLPLITPVYPRNRTTRSMLSEKKVLDINAASYAVENTGTIMALLNGCVAGSQNFNRIGRKICLKSLQIRGVWQAGAATVNDTAVRMLIVYDKQPNGAAPTFANVISSQNIAGTVSSLVYDMVNLDNRDRFEIIRDQMHVIQAGDISSGYFGSPSIVNVDHYVKLGSRETVFNAGAAGTVGDIATGSLYVMFIASQANASGANFVGSFRTRFEDK